MDRLNFFKYQNLEYYIEFKNKTIAYKLLYDKVYLMGYVRNYENSQMMYQPIRRADKNEIDKLLNKCLRRKVDSIAVFCQD
ncbi:hypothetical protein J4471_04195 [Candidatus Woesearchaeota archaeon]|nr:hypothetical protein [Candidatus Woesearchaeota archaeon]